MTNAPDIAIVIPSFNSAPWLKLTLESIEIAAKQVGKKPSVLLVDDGSNDSTESVVKEFNLSSDLAVKTISQINQGRFAARKNGAEALDAEWLFFIDSRVRISQDALSNFLRFLEEKQNSVSAVNGLTHTVSNEFTGLFWEIPTKIFWGEKIGQDFNVAYTQSNFETLPKGTGLLFIRRAIFLNLCHVFESEAPTRYQSDDTKILRDLAKIGGFWFVPSITAQYIPNTGLRRFLKHTFGRGIYFWDSFANTKGVMNLTKWATLLLPAIFIPTLGAALYIFNPVSVVILLTTFLFFTLTLAAVALHRGATPRAALSFLSLLPIFVPIYWAGIVYGIYKRSANF